MFSTRVSFALFACVALLAVTPVIADTEYSCMDKCDGTVAAASICGGENVTSAYAKGLGTCAETKTEIFDKADYKGNAHMVPCDPHHCEETCTAVGTVSGGTIECFNISKGMYMSKADANDAALSRGCKGSHAMGSMFMPGAKHDGCKTGENYFDVHSGVAPHGAAVALFMSLVVVCLGGFLADRVEM